MRAGSVWVGRAALAAMLVSMCWTSPAFAQAGARSLSAERLLYLGIGVLRSRLSPDTDSNEDLRVDERGDTGLSLSLGMNLFPRLSVEGHLADAGNAGLSDGTAVDYRTGGVSALLYGIHSSRFRQTRTGLSMYGRLGLGYLDTSADVPLERVNRVHALVGLGLEYGFDAAIGVRAEVVSHDSDARYGAIGVLYRFGRGHTAPADDVILDRSAERRSTSAAGQSARADGIVRNPIDTDADGVPDLRDDCADTRSARLVDDTGCALNDGNSPGIAFTFDSDVLTRAAARELDVVLDVLRARPSLRVAIEAHTDNAGNAMSNLQLSSARAMAVAGYLVQRGVAATRLQPRAFGESLPRVANTSADGRARNRRVEFRVLE